MLMSILWMPNETLAASIRSENCSTRSLTGSSTCPGVKTTPTPAGSSATSVPCTAEISALSALADAKLNKARLSPASTCWVAAASSGARQAKATATATATTRTSRCTNCRPGVFIACFPFGWMGISLIGPAVVPEPAGGMVPLRIVVRPVDHAAFRVPFVLAIEGDRVACAQRFDALREIDVVGDQQRPPGIQPDDEALMPAAIGVVRQHLNHRPLPGQLLVAGTVREGGFDGGVAAVTGGRRDVGGGPAATGRARGRGKRQIAGRSERGDQ